MSKQLILTVQKVEITNIKLRLDDKMGQILEMPLTLHVTYDKDEKNETFYPWALLSPESKQKVADVLTEVRGLLQVEYLN